MKVCLAVVFCILACSNCLAGRIVFDDSHQPANTVFERNPICPHTDGIRGGYFDLYLLLADEGQNPEVLESPGWFFTPEVLEGKCLVIINAPCYWGNCSPAYQPVEIAALLEYTYNGGGLLVMTEPFLRHPLHSLIMWMAFSQGDSIITHGSSWTYEVEPMNLILDRGAHGSRNLMDHPVMEGVNEVVLYGADFLNSSRSPDTLLKSENFGRPPAAMAAGTYQYGEGHIVMIGDSDWVSNGDRDSDGVINLYDRDNNVLVANIVNWLCPKEDGKSYARSIGYWKHQCRGNGHTEISQDSLQAMEASIRAASSFFTECYDSVGCDLLLADPPSNDMMKKAAQQLYSLWLNRESGKLPASFRQNFLIAGRGYVRIPPHDELIAEIEGILCDPASTQQDIEYAKDLAESVNTSGHEDDNLNAAIKGTTISPGEVVTIPMTLYNCGLDTQTYEITTTTDLNSWVTPDQVEIAGESLAELTLNLQVPDGAIDGITVAMIEAVPVGHGETSVEFVGAEIVGTAGAVGSESWDIGLDIQSNPAAGSAAVLLWLDRDQSVELAIYDVGGRLVRPLMRGPLSAGSHRLYWDGKDGFGKPVAAGVYFARLTGFGFSRTNKIILAR